MLRDQKLNERRVRTVEAVIAAESPRIATAQIAMVAAAPFRNVVKNRGYVKHPGPIEIRHQLAAQRIFMSVLGERKATQIAQYLQDVLIDGVDMKQVVLHLSDDAAEH